MRLSMGAAFATECPRAARKRPRSRPPAWPFRRAANCRMWRQQRLDQGPLGVCYATGEAKPIAVMLRSGSYSPHRLAPKQGPRRSLESHPSVFVQPIDSRGREMRFYRAVALISIALVPFVAPARAEQNAQDSQVEARIPRAGTKMAVGFNSLWLVCKDSLARISLSDHVITDIPASGLSTLTLVDVVIGEDAVWVPSSTTLYKIDPQRNAVVQEIAADNFGGGLAVGEGSVW